MWGFPSYRKEYRVLQRRRNSAGEYFGYKEDIHQNGISVYSDASHKAATSDREENRAFQEIPSVAYCNELSASFSHKGS